MQPIEIIVIILTLLFLAFIIGRYIYRKVKHLPTGDCACCSHTKKGNNLVRAYLKKYNK